MNFSIKIDEAILHLRLLRLRLAMTMFLCILFAAPSFAARNTAPDFPVGLDWLNVDKPLTIKGLHGKFILLDFWTYCCINCQHIIPDLKKLEAKYPDQLVVIGVHSAKFKTEADTDNIREAILRHDIEHPVVNDPELLMWRAYEVNSWPTVVLIDPEGNVITRKSGEGVYSPIAEALDKNLPKFKNALTTSSIALSLEKNKTLKSILQFPGKIVSDGDGKHLFISDSGHHRILMTSFDGTINEIIGTGEQGKADGKYNEAEFSNPQGMVYANNYLYVADTDNHLIRRIDLVNKTVSTIAGTGVQTSDREPQGQASQTALSSPWDLVLVDGNLYIAMAGVHQIWVMDVNRGDIKVFAGNGRENIVDGPLAESSLAQTSGITTDGKKLYFVDSETSSVRMADLDPKGKVETIIGKGLFDFGDADGDKDTAQFQHPLGITYHNGVLYVADTYNSKIKSVDPINRNSKTFVDETAGLNEPGGLTFVGDAIFVADTNNSKIAKIDLISGKTETIKVHVKGKERMLDPAKFKGDKIVLPIQGVPATINLDIHFDDTYELLMPTQSLIRVYGSEGQMLAQSDIDSSKTTLDAPEFGDDKIYVEAGIYYCRHTAQGICLFKDILFEAPIDHKTKTDAVNIELKLPAKKDID